MVNPPRKKLILDESLLDEIIDQLYFAESNKKKKVIKCWF